MSSDNHAAGLFLKDDAPGFAGSIVYPGESIAREDFSAVNPAFMKACPSYSCNQCDHPGCIFGNFIRHYRNHPRCD
jgi:hypothetical protein